MTRQETLDRVCSIRGLPNLSVGAICEMDGRRGVIVGGNASQNLAVVFDGDSFASNCHPHHKMRIFNAHGGVQYESADMQLDRVKQQNKELLARIGELELRVQGDRYKEAGDLIDKLYEVYGEDNDEVIDLSGDLGSASGIISEVTSRAKQMLEKPE